MVDAREYATDNGFYVGDKVRMRSGEVSFIEKIMEKGHWTFVGEDRVPASVVRLRNGKVCLDVRLTRIK